MTTNLSPQLKQDKRHVAAVMRSLREKGFVCEVTDRASFAYLSNEERLQAINQMLELTDERIQPIAATRGSVFSLTFIDSSSPEARVRIDRVINAYTNAETQRTVCFFDLLHDILKDSDVMEVGYRFLYSFVLERIQSSDEYKDKLHTIDSRGDEEPKKFKRVLTSLVLSGYLNEVDRNEGRYEVTGKIVILYRLLELLSPHQPSDDDDDDFEGDESNAAYQPALFEGA